MTEVIRKTAYLLRHESRLWWALVIALAMVVTAVEAFGALLIFALLGLVASPGAAIELPLVGDVRQFQGTATHESFIVWIAGGVAAFFFARGILLIVQVYVQDRLAYNAGARLSSRLLRGYLAMPYVVHLRRNSAELIRNAYDSVRAVTSEVMIPMVRLLSNIALALGLLLVLFLVAPLATSMALAFLSPLVVILVRLIQPRLKRLGRKRQRLAKDSLKILQQSLHGIRDVALFGRGAFFLRAFSKRQLAAARVSYLNRVAQEVPRVLVETALVVFISAFFIVSVTFQGSPHQALAVLGLFAYAALRLQPAVHKIVQCLNSLRFASAAVENIYDDLRLAEASGRGTIHPRRTSSNGLSAFASFRLEEVEFRYPDVDESALQGVSLEIRAGESIGIIGPTGGGKSTLVDIISGLLQPGSGVVLVNGVDLRRITADWQARLGVVSQSVFLIDDTLRRNIAFGLDESDIDEGRVLAAVDRAQLATFVDALPLGLDTMVGERGVRLSGGQRQRVAIARALYRNPEVLILDEGTSALDNATEAEFMSALAALRGSRTIIAVAHRLSTVENCDRVVLVEDGRVAAVGEFGQLAAEIPSLRRSAGVTHPSFPS